MEYISVFKDDLDLTQQHRYLRLPHPRTGQPQLYIPYTSRQTGKDCILEVVKINCAQRRTWFIGDSTIDSGSILLHPPIDPLFILIPILFSLLPSSSAAPAPPFQPLPDLIAQASASPTFALPDAFTREAKGDGRNRPGWNEDVGRLLGMRSVRRVMKLMCERKVVPAVPLSPSSPSSSTATASTKGQAYYRPSLERMIHLLRLKVDVLANPAEFEKFDHLVRGLGRDGLLSPGMKPDLLSLARTKASSEHMAQYLPQPVYAALQASYDFTPLTTYLADRAALTVTASLASTKSDSSVGSDGSGAKGGKRKASASASRGVEALKKVNTGGMSKLTSFFKPKEGKK